MSNPRSLSMQRQCVEHLIALCDNSADATVIEGAKQAALTIGWIERRGELLRMLETLRQERPELYVAMNDIATTFPGVKISDVRGYEPHNAYAESGDF
ncbi:MAG: hypothetical protein ACRCYS_17585 [Beijerinckiaceae bacterium]